MKFKIEEKAKKYINEKNIKSLLIKIDQDSREACCGLGNIDFIVKENIGKARGFKKVKNEKIDIYYDPGMEFYFKDDDEVIIGLFKFFKFKKLLIKNEVNILK